jgi:two-component system, cell cycle sensor histidine kinase and response regulator CckA
LVPGIRPPAAPDVGPDSNIGRVSSENRLREVGIDMLFRHPSRLTATLDTEAAQAQQQSISQVRAPIQQLADSNLIGIFFTKRDGPIVDANDEFLRMVGYSRDDLEAGRLDWKRLTPPEWSVANRDATKQLEETGKALPFEKEYLRKDGSRVPILIGIVAVSQPEVDRLCFIVDLTERKQAEKDLDRLMIERFAVLDSIGEGIYGQDAQGRCTFINAAGARMLGYEPAECHGQDMHELMHFKRADGSAYPVEDCPIFDAFRKCVAVRVDDEVVWRKDGTPVPVEYSSYPIIVNGHLEGCVVSFQDIGARREAEKKLRASEERFRSAFAQAAAGMCITDLEGRFLEVNQAVCQMTGYSEEELLAGGVQAFTDPTEQEMSTSLLDQVLRKEIRGFVTERRYTRKDGRALWARCSVAVLYDDAGNSARFVTIAEDITERVQAETDLRRSEERYRCIVENTHEGICMCDAAQRITYRNPQLGAMLGYPEGACFECSDIHFQDDQEEAKRRFQHRAKGVCESFDTRLRRADGQPLWVSCSASPIPDDQGAFLGALCMFTDVTARKHLEEQLRQLQKMEAIGQLAGGIAHDFNNLLTVILGYSGVLERKLAAEDPRLRNVIEIKKAGERAAALTQKLLAFSRKQVLRPRAVSINHLVRDMEAMLRRLIGEGIELVTTLDPALGSIQADPSQMEQVILNLAINARDAMPKGGHLLIESQRQELDPVAAKSRSLPPGAYVLLAFTDTGSGMDEQTKARAFEPFFTTKGLGLGTGLGLSTVLGIVNQSGGAISVYSEINVGSSFKIWLPLVAGALVDAVAGSQESRQHSNGAPAGETILVVEDDDSIRSLAREILEEHGYRVLEAASGEDALRAAELAPGVDLLVTDVIMKGMNGDALASRLLSARPGMQVLYMSGYTETGIVQQGVLGPGINFLSKPFQPRELLFKVGEVLQKKTRLGRILVADDEVQMRSFLATLLESEGYAVSQASNGREAQDACRQSLPDLVVMDLVMPEQEGLETILAIRRQWPHMPVIAISGVLGGAFLELAGKLGANAVFRKPLEPDVILTEIRRLIAIPKCEAQ